MKNPLRNAQKSTEIYTNLWKSLEIQSNPLESRLTIQKSEKSCDNIEDNCDNIEICEILKNTGKSEI